MQTDQRPRIPAYPQGPLRLEPYQKVGVKLIQKTQQRNGGTLLADEQGLGNAFG